MHSSFCFIDERNLTPSQYMIQQSLQTARSKLIFGNLSFIGEANCNLKFNPIKLDVIPLRTLLHTRCQASANLLLIIYWNTLNQDILLNLIFKLPQAVNFEIRG